MMNNWLPRSILQRRLWRWALVILLAFVIAQYAMLFWYAKQRQHLATQAFLQNVTHEINERISRLPQGQRLQSWHDGRLSLITSSMIAAYQITIFAPDGQIVIITNDAQSLGYSSSARSNLQHELTIYHLNSFESWLSLDRGYSAYIGGTYQPILRHLLSPLYLVPFILMVLVLLGLAYHLHLRAEAWNSILAYADRASLGQNRAYQPLTGHAMRYTDLRKLGQLINRNAYRIERYRHQMAILDYRQTHLVDNAPVSLFLTNRRGQITYFNDQFAQTFGISFNKSVTYMLSDFVFGTDKITQQHLAELSEHPARVSLAVTNLQGDQHFALQLKPFYNRFGKLAGFSGALLGVSDYYSKLIHAAQVNKQLTDRIDEIDKLWAEMSHELRTPLTGTLGMLDLLLENKTKLDGEQADTLATMQQSAQMMLQLLNDMLDAAKLNAGKLQTNIDYVDLVQLVRQVAELMLSRAKQQKIQLYVFFDPQVPHFIDTDGGQLRQILLNLLSNAIKFTQQGYVAILIDSVPYHNAVIQQHHPNDSDAPYWLRICVKDTGIGIKDADQAKLFKYFNQANASISQQFGGTGLGLAISNRFSQLLSGFIHLNSTFGQGSEFQVYFPLKRYSRRPVFSMTPEHLSVYVVTLSPFELVNQRLAEVFNGFDIANTSFRQLNPDTLAKIRQTNLTGYQLILLVDEALYQTQTLDFGGLTHCKKILLSMDKSEHIEPKRAAQYDAIVRKPIFLNVLIGEIKQLCRTDDNIVSSTNKQSDLPPQVAFKAFLQQWQSQQSSGVSTNNQTQNASHTDKPMLFRSKTILVAEDNVLNQKIIEKHLAILGYPSIIATNGEEAIEQLNAKRNQIGLILMDCRMPILDGLEASRLIRAQQDSIPIIALTASDTDDDRTACLQAGMDDFLSKPVNREKLAQMLQRHLLA